MSDYTQIERPAEPFSEDVDPEQWCQVLAWEEARADKAEKEIEELKKEVDELKNAIDLMFSWFATVNDCAPAQGQRDAFNKWRDESDEIDKASCLIGKDLDSILRDGRAVRERNALQKEVAELKKALSQAEENQREAEEDLAVLVNIVPQKYLDEAREERFGDMIDV